MKYFKIKFAIRIFYTFVIVQWYVKLHEFRWLKDKTIKKKIDKMSIWLLLNRLRSKSHFAGTSNEPQQSICQFLLYKYLHKSLITSVEIDYDPLESKKYSHWYKRNVRNKETQPRTISYPVVVFPDHATEW